MCLSCTVDIRGQTLEDTKFTRVYQGKANMSKMSTRVLLTLVSSVKLQAQICLV